LEKAPNQDKKEITVGDGVVMGLHQPEEETKKPTEKIRGTFDTYIYLTQFSNFSSFILQDERQHC